MFDTERVMLELQHSSAVTSCHFYIRLHRRLDYTFWHSYSLFKNNIKNDIKKTKQKPLTVSTC